MFAKYKQRAYNISKENGWLNEFYPKINNSL